MTSTIGNLLVSAWLGASVLFASAVAPAAFAVLPSRMLAGQIVGRVLTVVFVSGIVVAVIAFVLDRAAVGRARRARRAALVIVAVACAAAQFAVAPRIERIRSEVGGAIETLPETDARRIAFGRLHALSVVWLGLAMVAAGSAIVLTMLPRASRRGDISVSAATVARLSTERARR